VDNHQTLITLCLASFVGNISFSLLFYILPYYAQAICDSPSRIGSILAGYYYVTTMFLVPLGILTDKMGRCRMLIAIGRSPVMLLGLTTSFASIFLISLMNSFSALLTAAIFCGVGTSNSNVGSLCSESEPNFF